jgi:hypothetical protein
MARPMKAVSNTVSVAAVAVIVLLAFTARADIVVVSDPDAWIEQAMRDITEGRTGDFARNFSEMVRRKDIAPLVDDL